MPKKKEIKAKFDVLDQGFVRVVDGMGSDISILDAARISFKNRTHNSQMKGQDYRLLNYLWMNGHTSPFRHAFLQFHIKAPIFVLRQWKTHKVGCSWNEQSGRYTEMNESYYTPDKWRKQSKKNKQGSEGLVEEQEEKTKAYQTAVDNCFDIYKDLLAAGVAKEQARLILPASLYTECYWTCSIHALLFFIEQRTAEDAQQEIRLYANAVKDLAYPYFPAVINLLD